MSRHLYVCVPCRKQIEKIFHHKDEVPNQVPCPTCGKLVSQFRLNNTSSSSPPHSPSSNEPTQEVKAARVPRHFPANLLPKVTKIRRR